MELSVSCRVNIEQEEDTGGGRHTSVKQLAGMDLSEGTLGLINSSSRESIRWCGDSGLLVPGLGRVV